MIRNITPTTTGTNLAIDRNLTNAETSAEQPTNLVAYTPPALVALGNLELVQGRNGFYYDGPHSRWLQFNR